MHGWKENGSELKWDSELLRRRGRTLVPPLPMCILITDETYDIHCPTDTGDKLLSTAINVVVVAVVALFTRARLYIYCGMVGGW